MLQIESHRGFIAIVGGVPATKVHAHHAIQIALARPGAALCVNGSELESVLIDADTPHSLSGASLVTLLLEPESHAGQTLKQRYFTERSIFANPGVLSGLSASPDPQALLELLAPGSCLERHLDPRIADIVGWLEQLEREHQLHSATLKLALKRVCLSEGRFLHLFKQETGTAWRAMLVWRLAQVAMRYASQCGSLTQAAHWAGYSDSAHLSRQFKRLFGLTPSAVLKNSQFVQVA